MKSISCVISALLISFLLVGPGPASADEKSAADGAARKALYLKTAALTGVPWYFLAACEQYERSVKKDADGLVISPVEWTGPLNPDRKSSDPLMISLFGGIGRDGSGDGRADLDNPEDVLYSFAAQLVSRGVSRENIKIAIWNYYERGKAVRVISEMAKIYQTYDKVDLSEHSFPIPKRYNYDYKNTWGASRGWGGRRIHEGTDIFADYGTPVRATSYGYVEMIGWNKFGGWRLGIRSINDTYHYYAHLNGYSKGLKKGDVVKPGQVIGSVGSSGYGPKGTQGKFPPHLHYGVYKDNGVTEFSFDPYPLLRSWERTTRD